MSQHDTLTLEPCPFCGRHVEHVSRADNHSATGKTYIVSCFCGGYSACAHQQEDTLEEVVAAWNRRAALSATQPAQAAQSVPGVNKAVQLIPGMTKEQFAYVHHCALEVDAAKAETARLLAENAALKAQAAQPVSRDVIRDVFLRNGFTIKDGCSDLKPYVYAAANALLEVAAAQPVQGVPEDFVRIPRPAFDKAASALRQYSQAPVDYHRSVLRMRDALRELTASPTPPAQQAAQGEPEPEHADHVPEIAARLRLVARLAGCADAIPEDDRTAVGCIFSVLGNMRRALELKQAAQGAGEVDTGPRVLREVLSVCEDTMDKMALETAAFSRGRAFEAKGISRAIGTWFQDEFCGLSHMGEPVAAPTQPAAGADVLDAQRWQLRCETLRALFPSAPSDYELDAAINAAIAASGRQS